MAGHMLTCLRELSAAMREVYSLHDLRRGGGAPSAADDEQTRQRFEQVEASFSAQFGRAATRLQACEQKLEAFRSAASQRV